MEYPVQTKGLWGSGDATERERPTSMVVNGELNGKSDKEGKRRGGRIRRIFGIFKKGNVC